MGWSSWFLPSPAIRLPFWGAAELRTSRGKLIFSVSVKLYALLTWNRAAAGALLPPHSRAPENLFQD